VKGKQGQGEAVKGKQWQGEAVNGKHLHGKAVLGKAVHRQQCRASHLVRPGRSRRSCSGRRLQRGGVASMQVGERGGREGRRSPAAATAVVA